jgi:repressor LexA
VQTVALPLLGFIQAGQPIPAPGSDMVSENPFSDETVLVPVDLLGQGGDLFALQVKGDSLVDALVADGDYVILRKQETADPGDMVAVWLEDDVTTTLKFIYPRDGGEIELRPANPRYDPIVKPEDVVRISGKVVAVLRSLEGVWTQRKR